ncbi:MAG TPA: OFA family MFS transporter [Bryobacteraceae bacterium]|nr:OFA family MFS transporter [Bryobacteraceae bacterium]
MPVAEEKLPNRWVMALAALVSQLCYGSVPAWSVFTKPLMAGEGWSLMRVSTAFMIAMTVLGIGSYIGGSWQDRAGPRRVASVAGLLYGLGFLIAALGATLHSLIIIYIGLGLFCGLGMGMGYICPIALMAKWFPDHRATMTGAAVMGFGGGAFIFSPIAARLIVATGIAPTFVAFGIGYGLLVLGCARLYRDPPEGWAPAGWQYPAHLKAVQIDFTARQALGTLRFWLLASMLSINTLAGNMILSQASPLTQQQTSLDAIGASTIVGMLSIFNALGRVFWARLSDTLGRAETYFTLFAIQVFIFFALPSVHGVTLYTVLMCTLFLCYGGGFGLTPSFTADLFGVRNVGGIFGWIMLVWGFAIIPSPILIARVREATGNYDVSLYAIGVLMVIALALPILARREIRKVARARHAETARATTI